MATTAVHARSQQTLEGLRNQRPADGSTVSAAFSPSGNHLLLANENGAAAVWRTADGAAQTHWPTLQDGKNVAASFLDEERICLIGKSAAAAGRVLSSRPVWRLAGVIGGPNRPESPLDGPVLALQFSRDNRLLAIGSGQASRSGQVILWDLANNAIYRQLEEPHDDDVLGVAFSRDGKYLATSSADRMMKVFQVSNGRLVQSFEGHTHHVLDVAWRANGLQLATASADKTIKVWDFASGEQLRTISGAGKEITGIEFLGIGSQLVTSAGDGTVRIHNADDGKQIRSIAAGDAYLFCCAATASGDVVVAGGVDKILRGFNSGDGSERFKFPGEAGAN